MTDQWECGPHGNAWNGHDARCRRFPAAPPAGTGEALTTDERMALARAVVEAEEGERFAPVVAAVERILADRRAIAAQPTPDEAR